MRTLQVCPPICQFRLRQRRQSQPLLHSSPAPKSLGISNQVILSVEQKEKKPSIFHTPAAPLTPANITSIYFFTLIRRPFSRTVKNGSVVKRGTSSGRYS